MAKLTLLSIAEKIDSVREDIQFYISQKKQIAKSDPIEAASIEKYIETLRMKTEFLLETINNI